MTLPLASRYRRPAVARVLATLGLLFSFILSSALPAFAAGGQTGNISGTVLDSATKAPVSGARVTAVSPSGTATATTGGNGFFSLLGLNVDTYAISIEVNGYQPQLLAGVTVSGDQTLNLGNVSLTKELRTIAHVTARSANGAFQPSQTVDSYTISGNRILQTVGKEAGTNESQLLLSVPGVTLSNAGTPIIRGGGAREIGYQYDGVPFTEPFLGVNGSNGLVSGEGSVQVVEGAGDATQGNVGTGVVNVVPKRGTYPGFGLFDIEAGGPNFAHQISFEYGGATADGRISDYINYTQSNNVPYGNDTANEDGGLGYPALGAGPGGSYFANAFEENDQFTNNFVFKFGRDNRQSLQILYLNISQLDDGNLGGNPGGLYNPVTNPNALTYYPYDQTTQAGWASLFPAGTPFSTYSNLIGLSPGVPPANAPITTPQQNTSLETRYLKFEYDNNLTPSTYFALKYYNWDQLSYDDDSYSLGPSASLSGFGISDQSAIGGQTTGGDFDLTQQVGSKLTVNFNAKYDVLHPVWNAYEPQLQIDGLAGAAGGAACVSAAAGCPGLSDWLPGGYVYDYFSSRGLAEPRIPSWGIGYSGAIFDNWGSGLRFQYNPVDPLKLDFGVRYEGQDQHWVNQLDSVGQGPPTNPFDVLPIAWTGAVLQPKVWEPRAALTWDIDKSDAIRLGYGRSAVFDNAQTAGTPFTLYGLTPYLNIPAQPGFMCGIAAVKLFPCKSYAEELYWAGDAVEAPDAGNTLPALYNNYDFSISHQFKNGWSARVTPFYKLGTDLPSFALLTVLPGGNDIFASGNKGFNRTTGVEFNVTTPEHPVGISGFFSATYQNVLSTTPPLSINETNVPLLLPATLALGDLYRAGYVSPFSFRVGATYKTPGGLSVTPVLQYDIGYPYSLGNLIAATLPSGAFANVPQGNFGAGINSLTGIENISSNTAGGAPFAPSYYDPSDSGTVTKPNFAATRGTAGTSVNGGILSPANLEANLTIQYKRGDNTVGIQFQNLFGNAFVDSVPAANPFYQPVATGLSGPQTSVNHCQAQFGTSRGCANIPNYSYAFQNGAYLLSNGDFTGTTLLAPLQPMTIDVYYQRSL